MKHDKILRVALYIRVSHEEQTIKGLSLEAQESDLISYTKERGWIIQGTYIDAGKTARKSIGKRDSFNKMLEAVKRDEIDLILFTRLDRWFRNVGDYYKIMEIMEQHNCGWKTTQEDYDTTTASGRLYINLKLSIAQNEADMTGERINSVFDNKIRNGTVISGNAPFGYIINNDKKLEIDSQKASIIQEAYDYFESHFSKKGTIRYIRNKYDVNWCDCTFDRILKNELYTGVYNRNGRYNANFCEPIISREQFERVQTYLKYSNARHAPTGKIYIFTSILVCAECKHKLVGHYTKKNYYYRCNQHFQRGRCKHNREMSELRLQKWLLENLPLEIEKCKLEWEAKRKKRKTTDNKKQKAIIQRKLNKLKELFMNDLIELDEYKKDYDTLTEELKNLNTKVIELKAPNFEALDKLLDSNFRDIYDELTREQKRTLWRSIIKEIVIDNERNIVSISFL